MAEWIIEIKDGLPHLQRMTELVRCKDCKWGKEKSGNIECNVDRTVPPEYHGYEWFCPSGKRRKE